MYTHVHTEKVRHTHQGVNSSGWWKRDAFLLASLNFLIFPVRMYCFHNNVILNILFQKIKTLVCNC